MPAECTHLDSVEFLDPEGEVEGCAECLKTGDRWLHLRMCHSCGVVLCCDSSPNTHMTKHSQETGHPLMRSVEPNESWSWCYADQLMLQLRSN